MQYCKPSPISILLIHLCCPLTEKYKKKCARFQLHCNHIFKIAACTVTHKQTWLKISLHYSWMSVTKCYEYRWQLWLHWQAAEQLFVCPNGKYFVTRPCCPKDFLWHAAHITAAHHIKSLKTRLFCLWEAFASLPRHGRETLRHGRLMFVFLIS